MKINKKILNTGAWSLAVLVLIVSLGFAGKEQSSRKCLGIRIRVADQTGNLFIEPKDIMEVLNTRGTKVKGSQMEDINIPLLEKIVYSNPFVEKAEVYSTIDGYVNIDAWQRNPAFRVVNIDNEHFYVDEKGAFMPVTDKYTSPVIVASGFIFDDYAEKNLNYAVPNTRDSLAKPVLVQINEIANFIRSNEFWDAQIEQIYVNEKYEIELVPRVGNHTILLGNSENLEEKMENLMIFYKEATNKTGWEKYSMINLKFKDQVVGTIRNYQTTQKTN
jgi:cell division protein FtsQ